MPAKIIEAKAAPFTRTAVDPITLDIVENALRNARVEMDAVLFRTAMSPGIREQHDAFPMIANQEGKMVVGQFARSCMGSLAGTTTRSRTGIYSSPMIPIPAPARLAISTTGF